MFSATVTIHAEPVDETFEILGDSVESIAAQLPDDGSWGRIRVFDENDWERGWASSPSDWATT